jgi:hypothetical protein
VHETRTINALCDCHKRKPSLMPPVCQTGPTHNTPYLLLRFPKHIPNQSFANPIHPLIPLMMFKTAKYLHTKTSTRS